MPPRVDLEAEQRLAEVLITASEQALVASAHDLSEGGLAQALVESATRFDTGASIDLTALTGRDGVDLFTALFSESQARALVAVPTEHEQAFLALAAEHGVPAQHLGSTGGSALEIAEVDRFEVSDLKTLREGTLPRYFG